MVVVSGAMWTGVMMGAGMGRQRGTRGRGGTIGPTGDLPQANPHRASYGPPREAYIVHTMCISS